MDSKVKYWIELSDYDLETAGLNGDARIRGWRTTNPTLKYALWYALVFYCSIFNSLRQKLISRILLERGSN